MISENVIVERYALALFINMKKLGQIDEVFGEINYFFAQIQVNKSVEKLLLNKWEANNFKRKHRKSKQLIKVLQYHNQNNSF